MILSLQEKLTLKELSRTNPFNILSVGMESTRNFFDSIYVRIYLIIIINMSRYKDMKDNKEKSYSV